MSKEVCAVCGHDDPVKCSLYNYDDDVEEIEWLCGVHAVEAGYCAGCGDFCAGITSYDFHHPGLCDNCYDECSDRYFESDDDFINPDIFN